MILRGIFLCRPSEIHWLYQEGANQFYPDAFKNYQEMIPKEERGTLLHAY